MRFPIFCVIGRAANRTNYKFIGLLLIQSAQVYSTLPIYRWNWSISTVSIRGITIVYTRRQLIHDIMRSHSHISSKSERPKCIGKLVRMSIYPTPWHPGGPGRCRYPSVYCYRKRWKGRVVGAREEVIINTVAGLQTQCLNLQTDFMPCIKTTEQRVFHGCVEWGIRDGKKRECRKNECDRPMQCDDAISTWVSRTAQVL